MIVLLGQQRHFEVLDFWYHILTVQRADGREEDVKGIKLKRTVDHMRRFQVLNSQIFTALTLKDPMWSMYGASHRRNIPLLKKKEL
ncbi:cytoplasmic FMR1-interacting protein-like [Glossina fuscipes]|uniref:Cytoplasmic FMR1-interacting protein-like n=1 Tax=Glossina fuscipes TaxID=7396 RepID=A0A9C6DY05_9MUSC|nr:cytoplasmic FMR1-interacting protein-like [Glossina fuscipes]